MNPGREKYYKGVFFVAMLYDIILGIIFTFFFKQAFGWIGIAHKLPNYGAYLSLIGSFLFIIGVAYFLIFRGDLRRNLDLIIVGTLYKLAYFGVAIYYLIVGDYPHIIFLALFGVIDIIFFFMMLECIIFLRRIHVTEKK